VILYLDTSSLVKLYIQEPGTEKIRDLFQKSRAVATSQVAYAEACAAFTRKFRQGDFSEQQFQQVLDNLGRDWGDYFTLDVSWQVAKLAGALARQRYLRGFDAIHLASALIIKSRLESTIIFSSADSKLEEAASAESLEIAG
jgi:predicted nucleic acid-binding protein